VTLRGRLVIGFALGVALSIWLVAGALFALHLLQRAYA
jgi:hypothetical protein